MVPPSQPQAPEEGASQLVPESLRRCDAVGSQYGEKFATETKCHFLKSPEINTYNFWSIDC